MVTNLKLRTQSSKNELLEDLLVAVSQFECSEHYDEICSLKQSDQRARVTRSQDALTEHLRKKLPEVHWQTEYCANGQECNDAIDIYGERNRDGARVVIEMDKHRADQIAKKFLSRMALLDGEGIIYVTFCYGGTKNMNRNECQKYFKYCSKLAERLGCAYAAFICE